MLDEIFDQELSQLLQKESSAPVCEAGTPLSEARNKMQQNRSGCIVVLDGKKTAGIFTERDFLLKVQAENLSGSNPVSEFMVHNPVTVNPDTTIKEALVAMRVGNFRSLVVAGPGGDYMGVVTMKDLAFYITDVAGFQNE